MRQAKACKGNYFFKSDVLFHPEKISDQWVEQLMLPQTRHQEVMRFAHRTLTGGHCRAQGTRARIKIHFNWPGLRKDVSNLFLDAETVVFTWVLEKVIMYQSLRLCDLPYLL